MGMRNTRYTFGSVTKFFHWTISIIIITMLILGFVMTNIGKSPLQLQLYFIHKSLGLTVLLLIICRILWRFINEPPRYPDSIPKWEQKAAHLMQYIFYALMLIMPLSGWIMSTAANHIPSFWGLVSVPFPGIAKSRDLAGLNSQIHEIGAYILAAMVIIHVLAALKHHFLAKNNILSRMLPFSKDDQ